MLWRHSGGQAMHRYMTDDWRSRFRKAMQSVGMTDQELSVRAGLNRSTVNTYLSQKRDKARTKKPASPSIDNFIAMAKAVNLSPAYLLMGEEPFRIDIPVVGIVSAGEGFVPTDDDGRLGPVHFDVGDANVIAIEVRGDSMAPVYRQGDTLICHRTAARHADNLIGRDCAVRTRNGEHYIKILKRGSRVGLFTLRSFNPAHEDIEDVQIDWAAPVAWVKRGGR